MWLPMLIVPLVMVAVAVMMFFRLSGRHGGAGMCGFGNHEEPPTAAPEPTEDPLAALRARYAAGAIELDEFERRLDGVLRSDPAWIAGGRKT